jgi:hypothetical protein
MLTGILLEESLEDAAAVQGLHVVATERWPIPQPAAFQPAVWTALRFQEDDGRAWEVMDRLSRALKPAWYVNASTDTAVYVAFRGRLFSYGKGDAAARAQVVRHGLSVGVPARQLDWPE